MRHDRQVLICPTCRRSGRGDTELDRCHGCGSTDLVCRLGEIECRTCGAVRGATPQPPDATANPGTLSTEVAQALDRVLGHHRAR